MNGIAGAIVLLTGLYVTYYGYYEIRLYFTNAGPEDMIVHTAGVVQSWLVHQVDTLGVWPLLAALAVLIATAIGWRAAASPPRPVLSQAPVFSYRARSGHSSSASPGSGPTAANFGVLDIDVGR